MPVLRWLALWQPTSAVALIVPVSLSAVTYLAVNMRDIDAREIYNIRNHESPDLLAREVILAASFGKAGISVQDGRPVGIVGVSPLWAGVWTIWSYGTDEWRKGVLDMTRFGRKVLKPFLLARGAHRLQCESRVDHEDAHRWLASCDAKIEGVLQCYGRDGSDYYQFAWIRD